MGSSNDDLIEQAVTGDRQALITLLEEHAPRMYRRLAGKIPRRWQAVLSVEDVLQETYTDAFLSINRFAARHERAFGAWLGQIAVRNLVNALRMLEAEKRGGNRRAPGGLDPVASRVALYGTLGATQRTPSRYAARNEACVALDAAIRELPENHRRVVEMYDLEGRTMEEVAGELNRSPGAAHLLRFRAHRRLAAILGEVSKYLTTV